jgi:transketolase C-terminal domain/subunit
LPKIFTLEEERLAGGFGEGIGETVTEIQPGGMATFAIVGEAFAGDERVLVCYRLDGWL